MTEPRRVHHPYLEHELYLLRIWYEPTEPTPAWRASVHPPQGAPRKYFASRSDLIRYLSEVLGNEHRAPDVPT